MPSTHFFSGDGRASLYRNLCQRAQRFCIGRRQSFASGKAASPDAADYSRLGLPQLNSSQHAVNVGQCFER